MNKVFTTALLSCACIFFAACKDQKQPPIETTDIRQLPVSDMKQMPEEIAQYIKNAERGNQDPSSCWSAGELHLAEKTVSQVWAAGLATLNNVQVNGSCSIAGRGELSQVTIQGTLRCAGSCHAHDVNAQNVGISGSAQLEKLTVAQDLTVNGDAVITGASTIAGATTIRGMLRAEKSAFADLTVVTGGAQDGEQSLEVVVQQSTATTIVIENKTNNSFFSNLFGGSRKQLPVRLVLDGTTVEQDVVFKGLAGSIVLRNNALVKGTVVNGTTAPSDDA